MPETESRPASTDLGPVAREMTKLFKHQFGRGPRRAFATWAGPDLIVCTLEDTLTPAERKLIELGEHQAVREMRAVLEHATVPEFCAPIEAITGRKVKAFTSAVDTVADGYSVEIWELHPEAYEGPGRVELGAEVGEIGPGGRRSRTNLDDDFGPITPS
ncbi:MAG: DUF2294 family protein [Solirubrobacteraceae bacterium]|nr:DUF2294 family protein [Solirubrobacteraceae bacterium]